MEIEDSLFVYDDQSVQKFKTSKIIKEFHENIKAISFSDDGQYLGLCSDNYVWVYDIFTAKKFKKLPFKNHKLDLIKFSHNNQAILIVSQLNYKIYYWSIHDNEIIKIYSGHNCEIQSLCLNYKNDQFLSTSSEGVVRIWDLNQKNSSLPLGELDLSSKKCTAVSGEFDQSGCIFCIGYSVNNQGNYYVYFRLYDAKRYQEGAFKVWSIESNEIRVIKFSNDGNYLAANTIDGQIFIFDSFDGKLKNKFMNHNNDKSLTLQISFTPCSQYLVSGCEDGCIHLYSMHTQQLANELTSFIAHSNPVQILLFNPIYALLVSVSTNILILWQKAT